MFGQTWIKLLLLWIVWTALSIAWSPDQAKGFDRLGTLKFFAWLPLLWPLHRYWKWLFGGFLFSTMVLQGIQISGEFFGATHHGGRLAAGIRHPTMAGMWNAIALSCWLFLSVSAGWRILFLSIPMATLSAFGFFRAMRQKSSNAESRCGKCRGLLGRKARCLALAWVDIEKPPRRLMLDINVRTFIHTTRPTPHTS